MAPRIVLVLAAIVPVAMLSIACSGTTIRQSTDTGSTDPGADGGGSSSNASDGGGGSQATGDDAGIVLPATCPCPTGSYCDLSTNTCKLGCTDTSQCKQGDTCDVSSRTCLTPKAGLAGCPIPAGDGSDGGATSCNGVTPLGKDVAQNCLTGSLPAAHGGTVADGVYVLTSTDFYSATCSAGTYAATIYVCGNTWAKSEGASAASSTASTSTVTFSGTTFSLATSCGGTGSTSTPYDVTATGMTIYTAGGLGTDGYADHYTKQ